MGDPRAFLNIPRQEAGYRPVNGLRRTLLPLGMPDRE